MSTTRPLNDRRGSVRWPAARRCSAVLVRSVPALIDAVTAPLPFRGTRMLSTPARDSVQAPRDSFLPPANTETPFLTPRLTTSREGRARRIVRIRAAFLALRALSVTIGALRRRRTLTVNDGLRDDAARVAGSGTGTQLPTTLTGELSLACWPVWESNEPSMFGFPHRALPVVNSPLAPPSMFSVNDVTSRAGRPSNVVTSRVPESEVVAS